MWTTRWTQAASQPGTHDVILSDGNLSFTISLNEWWIMSATEYLANTALRENDLDFKIAELYGSNRIEHPLWTTEMVPSGDGHDVHLLRGGEVVVRMSLDEWASLDTNEYIVQDSLEVADGISDYGDNIEEVREALKHEEGIGSEDLADPDPEPPPQPKPRT